MDGKKKQKIVLTILVAYIIVIFATVSFLLSESRETERTIRDSVPTIPDVMMTFWNLNETEEAYIIEGHVINSTVMLGEQMNGLPIHVVTIEDEEGNAHTIWMVFDMEPNTYFKSYHNPVIYDYYLQFVVQETDYEAQQLYRCFYYRQLYEYC